MKVRRMAGLLGVVAAASLTFAEVSPDINTGSKAVLFSFSGLSNLGAGSYNGGIGGKFFLMEPIAIRASLGLGMANQTVPTTAASGGEDGSNSAMQVGLSAGAEYHLTFNRVSPYAGGMLSFSSTSTKSVSPINTPGGAKTTTENGAAAVLGYTPGGALGIWGLGGVEFFITKELSLAAEYLVGWRWQMGYEQKVTVVTGTTTTETKTKVPGQSFIGITNSGALTLAVYF